MSKGNLVNAFHILIRNGQEADEDIVGIVKSKVLNHVENLDKPKDELKTTKGKYMTNEEIKNLALENGFKLKEQPDGSLDLNPYVYEFAVNLVFNELDKIIGDFEHHKPKTYEDVKWILSSAYGRVYMGSSKKEFDKEKDMQTLKGSTQEYTKQQVLDAMNMLSDICNSASVRGGWWHDLTTGEPLERNKLEMLCLIHSEVSEACEGVRKGINDDHLPQYRMEDVEIADTLVRCFDYIGGHELKTAEAFVDKLFYNTNRADHKVENRVKDGGKKY